MPSDSKSPHCLWQGELKKEKKMNCNLVGSIYGRSSIKNAHFVLFHSQTWPPQAILVSDWLISKKSSPLKMLGQMNRNLVGSIYGRFRGKDFLEINQSDDKNCLWWQSC
jgi:hypothetical protein